MTACTRKEFALTPSPTWRLSLADHLVDRLTIIPKYRIYTLRNGTDSSVRYINFTYTHWCLLYISHSGRCREKVKSGFSLRRITSSQLQLQNEPWWWLFVGSAASYLCMECHEHAGRESSFLPWQGWIGGGGDIPVILNCGTDQSTEQQDTSLKPEIVKVCIWFMRFNDLNFNDSEI